MEVLDESNLKLWRSVVRAAESEPRSGRFIRGNSGIKHPVACVGIDEGRRRVIVVSQDYQARTGGKIFEIRIL